MQQILKIGLRIYFPVLKAIPYMFVLHCTTISMQTMVRQFIYDYFSSFFSTLISVTVIKNKENTMKVAKVIINFGIIMCLE